MDYWVLGTYGSFTYRHWWVSGLEYYTMIYVLTALALLAYSSSLLCFAGAIQLWVSTFDFDCYDRVRLEAVLINLVMFIMYLIIGLVTALMVGWP